MPWYVSKKNMKKYILGLALGIFCIIPLASNAGFVANTGFSAISPSETKAGALAAWSGQKLTSSSIVESDTCERSEDYDISFKIRKYKKNKIKKATIWFQDHKYKKNVTGKIKSLDDDYYRIIIKSKKKTRKKEFGRAIIKLDILKDNPTATAHGTFKNKRIETDEYSACEINTTF